MKAQVQKTWEYLGLFLGIWSIYKQLKTANEARLEIYNELPDDLKDKWNKLLGKPAQPVAMKVASEESKDPTLTQVQAGT